MEITILGILTIINTFEKFKAVSDILIFDRYGRIITTIKPNGLWLEQKIQWRSCFAG